MELHLVSVAKRNAITFYGVMELFQRIERLLELRGMTQADLSRATGIREPQFSQWKRAEEERAAAAREEAQRKETGEPEPTGKKRKGQRSPGPNYKQVARIARELGTTVDYLAGLSDEAQCDEVLTDNERTLLRVYRSIRPDLNQAIRAIARLTPDAERSPPAALTGDFDEIRTVTPPNLPRTKPGSG